MGLCHKYCILHLVIFAVGVEQPDNWYGPVDIKGFIWEKNTLQWTALAIVFWKSGKQHPDMVTESIKIQRLSG